MEEIAQVMQIARSLLWNDHMTSISPRLQATDIAGERMRSASPD